MQSDWNIAKYLPPLLQPHFDNFVREFVYYVREQTLRERAKGLRNQVNSTSVPDEGAVENPEFAAKLMSSYFGPKLFDLVNKIRDAVAQNHDSEGTFSDTKRKT